VRGVGEGYGSLTRVGGGGDGRGTGGLLPESVQATDPMRAKALDARKSEVRIRMSAA
jgi:hypothetical protein